MTRTDGSTRDAELAYLTTDHETGESVGHLRTPCCRYGSTTAECAPIAVRLAHDIARERGAEVTTDDLDFAMSLVVNDHDDVAHMISRDVREIAAGWHAGQGSALYAFASTGTVTDDLEHEIRECIAETKVHRSHYVEADRRELATLLAYVEADARRRAWLAQSRWLGADAALAGASWLTLSVEQARSVLDDIDPMVLDAINEPNLSGEWADDLTPELLAEEVGLTREHVMFCPDDAELVNELAEAWEEGRDLVWSDAVQAYALRLLGDVQAALRVEQENERKVSALRSESERLERGA